MIARFISESQASQNQASQCGGSKDVALCCMYQHDRRNAAIVSYIFRFWCKNDPAHPCVMQLKFDVWRADFNQANEPGSDVVVEWPQ